MTVCLRILKLDTNVVVAMAELLGVFVLVVEEDGDLRVQQPAALGFLQVLTHIKQ